MRWTDVVKALVWMFSGLIYCSLQVAEAEPLAIKGGERVDGGMKITLHDTPSTRACGLGQRARAADIAHFNGVTGKWVPWAQGCWISSDRDWVTIRVVSLTGSKSERKMVLELKTFTRQKSFKPEYFNQ